ncbi:MULTISPECIES: acetate/propionate family kinase [unclassified Arenibacter]|uniref:acetate/propionate family kinase n=1 Tax=unclassified Arenibacter TaxID=2615047 RepID=UPI000E355CCD|nr:MULTISPECIES: acetate kinase [unclassified Arenibacter]MCM4163400.1 acetate kinase [Arenibacter sp. A80]RFT57401.1 acetate kinase [Arenibacter sp. P308M17]
MNILILNAGSSSIKYQVIQMPRERLICKGMVECIGSKNATLKFKTDRTEIKDIMAIPDHRTGLLKMVELLMDPGHGVIKNVNDIDIVSHRVVHGGNTYSKTTLVTKEVKNKIRELSKLAPLHNPHNLEGIILAEQVFPHAQQIAVFDTAFHQTMPIKAKKYALPNEFYTKSGIQAYGFHGTSHKYVSEKAISYLQTKESKIITMHLGHGCSVTAVKNGKSVDHSMGFTPSNGLIMGTRSGDIDHALIFYLVNSLGYNLEDVNILLTKKSGMLGLTGYNDMRDIESQIAAGNPECLLALEMNAYRIKKYIGAYIAAMNGLDALVFTAGIGENSSTLRKLVCADMEYFGIVLDVSRNEEKSSELRIINSDSSKIKIMVIPTNEELEIAKQAYKLSHDL